MNGKQFECPMHGIDYRKFCTRCNEKSEEFSKVLRSQIIQTREDQGRCPKCGDEVIDEGLCVSCAL